MLLKTIFKCSSELKESRESSPGQLSSHHERGDICPWGEEKDPMNSHKASMGNKGTGSTQGGQASSFSSWLS
jgi:hypothetical protein